MGWKYEVFAWMPSETGYEDHPMYQGNSLFQALMALYTAKTQLKSGCITVKYRG